MYPGRLCLPFDGLAEMGDRLLKGGTSQRLVAGFAPPFDRGFDQPRLREVMREQLRLGRSGGDKLIAQNLTRAAVQCLATALKQVLISRILNERMLKAVFGFRRETLDQEYVGLGQPFQRRPQCFVIHLRDSANERVGEAPPDYSSHLCHLTRRSEAVQPRSQ